MIFYVFPISMIFLFSRIGKLLQPKENLRLCFLPREADLCTVIWEVFLKLSLGAMGCKYL